MDNAAPKPEQIDCPKCRGTQVIPVFKPGTQVSKRVRCPRCGRRFNLIDGVVAVKLRKG